MKIPALLLSHSQSPRHREREKMKGKNSPIPLRISPVTILSCLLLLLPQSRLAVEAQIPPAKFDGFVYGDTSEFNPDRILLEGFFDPVCPDTRDSWLPLKQALNYYGSRISLIVHPFALPYHDNSFVTSRALHIVNELNSSATYPLLEKFFKYQESFYNKETINMSKSEIVDHITDFVTKSVGQHYYSAVKSGFNDRKTDLKTRVSFKYGCSRGVYGTPTFFVNGFALPDADSTIDYEGWRKIIDPLVSSKEGRSISLLLMK